MEWVVVVFLAIGAIAWLLNRRHQTPTDRIAPRSEPMQRGVKQSPPVRSRDIAEIEERAVPFSMEYSVPLSISGVRQMKDFTVHVYSEASSDETYTIDLGAQTCTCQRFQSKAQKPIDYFGRWCKHLVRALDEAGAFKDANEWQRAIIETGHEGPQGALMVTRRSAPPVLITKGDSDEWLNVFANTQRSGELISNASGPIARFGWSVSEKRWAWGENPPGARELRRLLKNVTGIQVTISEKKD